MPTFLRTRNRDRQQVSATLYFWLSSIDASEFRTHGRRHGQQKYDLGGFRLYNEGLMSGLTAQGIVALEH
jgi:hypothetical protein